MEILELIISAIQSFGKPKLEALEKTSLKLNILKILIRLGEEVKILDLKNYLTLQKTLNEIGKMLGGWIKSEKKRKQETP